MEGENYEIQWWGPVGLPKATARVDSRLKLTFGQLVNKSTHHVYYMYLVVGAWLGLGLW